MGRIRGCWCMKTIFKRISAAFSALAVMAAAVALDATITITANAAGGCSYHDTLWNGEEISADGNYYLASGVELSGEIEISNEVTLCLNGQTITAASGSRVFTIKNGGSLTICDCGNTGTITGGNASEGGGVFVSGGGVFTMNGGTISQNTAEHQGGGVFVSSDGVFTMNGGTISGNTVTGSGATDGGGGVYTSGTFKMRSSVINGNTADKCFGGGVLVSKTTAEFTLESGTISGNSAKYGGGVHVSSSGNVIMKNGTIGDGNTASGGGGVSIGGGDFKMEGGAISGNQASGAGVYLSTGTFTMTNGVITNNTSSQGGGIQMAGGTLTLDGPVKIADNPSGKGNSESNIYLRETGAGASTCFTITIGAGFAPTVPIGVHIQPKIECHKDVATTQFAANASAKDISEHFKNDDDGQEIVYKDDKIKLHVEHDYGEWKITKAPGINTTGTAKRVCKKYSSHVETVVLPPLSDTDFWIKDPDKDEYTNESYGTTTPPPQNVPATAPPVVNNNNNDNDDNKTDNTPNSPDDDKTIIYKDPPTGISLSLAPPALAIAAITALLIRRKK